MKFNLVVGNPPYQSNTKSMGTNRKPLYSFFMQFIYDITDISILVVPSRFLFNAGNTSKKWNKEMAMNNHLRIVKYYSNSDNVFKNTQIAGGISIILQNNNKMNEPIGKLIGSFIPYELMENIVKKTLPYSKNNNLSDIGHLCNKFNLDILYNDYPEFKKEITHNGKEKRLSTNIFNRLSIFKKEKSEVANIKVYGITHLKRTNRYVNEKYLSNINNNLDKYKVIIPKSHGKGNLGEEIGKPIIVSSYEAYTYSYISFGSFNNKTEANNLYKYLKARFTRLLLSVLKVTQDNHIGTWKLIPLQDFTNNSDIDWNKSINNIDKQLYTKYNLNQKEMDFIETNVKEMD